jgi:hypothetical protein
MNDNAAPTFSASENGLTINEPVAPERTEPNAAPIPETPKTEKPKSSRIAKLIASVIILGLVAFAASQIDYGAIRDNLTAIGYEMSPEMSELANDIELTRAGERILMATRPELQEAADFNQSCNSTDVEAATLGCYNNNHIYIYNVMRSELRGIRQVTLVHELLHAVWARMNDSERSALYNSLKSVYDANEDVRSHLEIYSADDFYDELHSTVGSQIHPDNLPEALRNHYAKYLANQSKVAEYYDGYNSIFKAATERMEVLKAEIDTHRETIQRLKEEYTNENFNLTNDVNDFNARAKNGSFTSLEQFNSERQSLVQRQTDLRTKYQELQNLVTETNGLISEYNSNIARKTELYQSINSNIEQPNSSTTE